MDEQQALAVIIKAQDEASATLKKVQRELANTKQSVKDVGDQSESLSRLNNTFDGVGATVSRFGMIAGAATAAAGIASVKMAGDFEQSLNILGSVTSATDKQMAQLSETARQLGQDAALPGISAKDAAAAMTELGKAGLSVNDILTSSKGVLSLAKAGQIDVASAATVTARALNAFGLEGKEASRIADLLSAGANASTASVQDMAMGLQQVGAGAASMGVSLDDTVTALSMFSNAGINGSDAGTSLKTMLARLVPSTDDAAEAMQKLGLNFFDAKGNFVGLEDTSRQLQGALGKLSTEQRTAALNTIFGSDASRAASIFAVQGADAFNKMSTAVNKQGAATDLAAAQNSGFNGALDNLISTLETVGTDLGTKVLPPLTNFIKTLANGVQPAVDWAINNFPVLAAAMTTVAVAIGMFKLMMFVSALQAVGFAATNLGIAFTFLAAHPIILVFAALAGTLVFLQLKFDIFGKAVGIAKGVVDGFNPAVETAKNFLAGLVSGGLDLANAGIDRFNQALDASKQFITDHKNEILIAAGVLATIFGPTLIMLGTQALIAGGKIAVGAVIAGAAWVKQAALSAGAWLVALPGVVARSIWAGLTTAGQALIAGGAWVLQAGRVGLAWTGQFIAMVAKSIWAGVTMVAQAAAVGWAWLARGAMIALPWIIAFGSMVVGAIAAGVSIAAAGIAAAIPWLIAFAPVIAIVAAVAAAAWLIVTNWGVITKFMGELWDKVQAVVGGFINWIKGNWPLLLAVITGPIGLAVLYVIRHWDSIKEGAANMINGLIGFFSGLPGRIGGAVGNMGKLLYNSGRDLINGLLNGAGSLLSNIGNFFLDKVPGWIKEPFKKALGIHSPSRVFAGFGKNTVQGLVNGINGARGLIGNAMGNVSRAVSSGLSITAKPTIDIDPRNDDPTTPNPGPSFGGAGAGTALSVPVSTGSGGPQVTVNLTVNGNIIGNASGLRELAVILAQEVENALKSQGTTDVNQLRTA